MLHLLNALAARTPDATFVMHGNERYAYGHFAELVRRCANLLRTEGLEPGARVVISVSNRPLFLICWFAVLGCRGIAVPVSHELSGEPLNYVLGNSGATMLLTEAMALAGVTSSVGGPGLKVLTLESEQDIVSLPVTGGSQDDPPEDPRATAAILYTSGTTGEPKGVMIPGGSYVAGGSEIVRAIGITAEDRILTFLPLHHANPQFYALMSALLTGCSLILLPRFSASGLLAQAERYQATGFTYVGTVLSILSKVITEPKASTLRWCVGGGAPELVWRDVQHKLGLEIHELYGMTETGAVTTINSRSHTKVGSVGRAREDLEVIVVDALDQALGCDAIGEIVVRPKAPNLITSGYFAKPVETLASLSNLWFHTGDLGRFDSEGFLYFTGRKKELFRRAGEMISPVTIEFAANSHPQVRESAAVALPDDILGDEIKLVVVAEGALEVHGLITHLKARLRRVELPRYLDVVDAIPKTSTEKIQRFKLIENNASTVDLQATGAAT